MRFSQLVFVEFGTLLCIFFIISKSLHYSVEFGKFAFLCYKEGTYNKLCFLCPSVFVFLYLVYIWFPYFVIIILSILFFFFFGGLFDWFHYFPITHMWFEPMEVCATHILSPIVSYALSSSYFFSSWCLLFFLYLSLILYFLSFF